MSLAQYKTDFIQSSVDAGVLSFGSFTLKSGRTSPYFFNSGNFITGAEIDSIATAFAKAIIESELEFDIIFGPAYKGIPLACTTALVLSRLDKKYNKAHAFDRKEAKDHGEGGNFVGAPLKGKRCLIIDDVVTAGTAKREAIEKIRKEGGIVAGVIVALDRMERLSESAPGPSAIGELRREYKIPVLAVITLDDIIGGLRGKISDKDIESMEEYRRKYQASD